MIRHDWGRLMKAAARTVDMQVINRPLAIGDVLLDVGAEFFVNWGDRAEVRRAQKLYERRAIGPTAAWVQAHIPNATRYFRGPDLVAATGVRPRENELQAAPAPALQPAVQSLPDDLGLPEVQAESANEPDPITPRDDPEPQPKPKPKPQFNKKKNR